MFELILVVMTFLLIVSWILVPNSLINMACFIVYIAIIWKAYEVLEEP